MMNKKRYWPLVVMNEDIKEWLGPLLANELARYIGKQVRNDVEEQMYSIEFSIRYHDQSPLEYILKAINVGDERFEYRYRGDEW